MTEEIKEVLDYLKKKDNTRRIKCITTVESIQLLDYITNLQQENEFLKLNNPEMNIEHFRIVKENKRKIDNLRKENERLNNKIKEQNLLLIEFQDMEQKVDIYKSRCEKAIEYINNNKLYNFEYDDEEIFEMVSDNEARYYLVNILNGIDGKMITVR